jgi:hypothetical protein
MGASTPWDLQVLEWAITRRIGAVLTSSLGMTFRAFAGMHARKIAQDWFRFVSAGSRAFSRYCKEAEFNL